MEKAITASFPKLRRSQGWSLSWSSTSIFPIIAEESRHVPGNRKAPLHPSTCVRLSKMGLYSDLHNAVGGYMLPVCPKRTRALNGLQRARARTKKNGQNDNGAFPPLPDSLSSRPSRGSVTNVNRRISSRTSLATSPAARGYRGAPCGARTCIRYTTQQQTADRREGAGTAVRGGVAWPRRPRRRAPGTSP